MGSVFQSDSTGGDNTDSLREAIGMAWARFSTQPYPWWVMPLLTVQVVSATAGLLLGYFIPAWFTEPRETVYEDLPEQSIFKGEPN